jgi:hypothetical protein
MKCEFPDCKASTSKGDAFYRINEKGVSGLWKCQVHIDPNTVDPGVRHVTEIIRGEA